MGKSRSHPKATDKTPPHVLKPSVTISRENIYSFEDDETAKRLSTNYALYKAAFLSSIPESQQKSIADLLVGRDYLSY